MAITKRTGGNSFLIMGRQSAYGTPITEFSKMIPRRFPFTSNTLDETGEQVQSESIIGGGSDSLNSTGILGGGGRIEMEVLPEDIVHILRGVFNPTEDPVSAAVADDTDFSSITFASGNATTTVDLAPKSAVPSKLELTLSGDPTGTGSSNPRAIIKGFRKIGRPAGERFPTVDTITLTSTTKVESKKLFQHVNSVELLGVASGVNLSGLKFNPDTHMTVIKLNDQNDQFPGWTYQMSKGGMPVIAHDVIPGNFELSVGTNIRAAIDVTASQVTNRRMIDQGDVERLVYLETVESNKSALTNFPRGNLAFYPRWGGALIYGPEGSDITPFSSFNLGINHNYEVSEEITGSRFAAQPEVSGDGVRQVTANWDSSFRTGNTATDTFLRWQELYRDNSTARIEFNMFNYTDSGRQYRIRFVMPRFQLTTVPVLPIEGRGAIPRRIEGKFVPTDTASAPNEIEVTIWSENAYAEAA